MSTDRTSLGASFWVTVAAVALLAYPASLGPSCWVSSRTGVGVPVVDIIYRPILRATDNCPQSVLRIIQSYSAFGAAPEWGWVRWETAGRAEVDWHWEEFPRWPP